MTLVYNVLQKAWDFVMLMVWQAHAEKTDDAGVPSLVLEPWPGLP